MWNECAICHGKLMIYIFSNLSYSVHIDDGCSNFFKINFFVTLVMFDVEKESLA